MDGAGNAAFLPGPQILSVLLVCRPHAAGEVLEQLSLKAATGHTGH